MDLIAIAVANLLLLPMIYGLPLDPVRAVLGTLIVVFFPGYTLLAALYPRRGSFDGVERIVLSIGLSLALTPLLGLALNFSPWGIRLTPIVLTLTFWNLALAAVAWRQRQTIASQEQTGLRWDLVSSWVQKSRTRNELVVGGLLTILVLFMVGATVWKVQQEPPSQPFTEFYVLGAGGMLQDYPTELRMRQPQGYTVGVVNQEGDTETYRIVMFLNGIQVGSLERLTLVDQEEWEGQVAVVPVSSGEKQRLELKLYRGTSAEAYRGLHIFVDVLELATVG